MCENLHSAGSQTTISIHQVDVETTTWEQLHHMVAAATRQPHNQFYLEIPPSKWPHPQTRLCQTPTNHIHLKQRQRGGMQAQDDTQNPTVQPPPPQALIEPRLAVPQPDPAGRTCNKQQPTRGHSPTARAHQQRPARLCHHSAAPKTQPCPTTGPHSLLRALASASAPAAPGPMPLRPLQSAIELT